MTQSLFVLVMIASFCVGAFAQDPEELLREGQRFVAENESRLKSDAPLRERFGLLLDLAPAAFTAQDAKKAERFARELVEAGTDLGRNSRFDSGEPSYAIHIGHTILGLIELGKGNRSAAGEHLIASATFEGAAYPVLKSFGPNMSLADGMIRKGDTQTVLRYFELCSKFWIHDRGILEIWRKDLVAGESPDFRGSLHTSLLNWRYNKPQ